MTVLAPPQPPAPPPASASQTALSGAGSPHRRPVTVLPPLLGALTTVGISTAIIPLTGDLSWLLPLVGVIAVIYVIGIASRILSLPTWAVELLQLGGSIAALTGFYLEDGIARVIPGPQAWHEASALLSEAWQQIQVTIPPAPVTIELQFFLGIALGSIALFVDLLISGSRVPAMIALPLLTVYTVASAINLELLPWYAAVLPALGYAALLAVDQPGRPRGPLVAQIAVTARGSIIMVLTIIAALFATHVATGIGTEGRVPRTGAATAGAGISPWALLRGDLENQKPVDLLSVTGISRPEYLRIFALEDWTPDVGFGLGTLTANYSLPNGPVQGAISRTTDEKVSVSALRYYDRYLPMYLDTLAINGVADDWSYDTNLGTAFRDHPTAPQPYELTVPTNPPTAADLRQRNIRGTSYLLDAEGIPDQVADLARTITAGKTNPFDQANAILDYFTDAANGFTYSLTTPSGNSGSAILDFLVNKEGYCEQFAATMAAMLRTIGIPARVGIGFTQGAPQDDGGYLVTSTNAHAWVEVNFYQTGWVTFDPTPPVAGQGGIQGFSLTAATTSEAPPTSSAITQPPTSSTAAPRSSSPPAAQQRPDDSAANPGISTATRSPISAWLPYIAVVVVGLAILAGLIALPGWIRRRRRRRRLTLAASHHAGSASAAWAEVVDTAIDHGIVLREADSLRVTANQLAVAARLTTSDRSALKTLVLATEKEWYDVLQLDDRGADTWPAVVAIAAGLRRWQQQSLSEKLLPRSLRPRKNAQP